MVKIINIFGDVYSGQAGKAGVFAKWKGRQYRRKYVIPANPKTVMQLIVRGYFTNVIAAWHTYHSIQRLVYSYLATGQVMSGMNLLVSRWMKAATAGTTLPYDPSEGIKQICSAHATRQDTNPAPTAHKFDLSYSPIEIGSLTSTLAGTDKEHDAFINLEMGDVQLPLAIDDSQGALGGGQSIAEGDQLVISYTSGGRTVTREVLFTVPASPLEIPAAVLIAAALRTAWYPIDIGSVVLETYDLSTTTYYQLESLEVDNINGAVYYDKTDWADASSALDYESYTAIETAKLEVTKVDTSFITWRRYSNSDGLVYVAQTVEDETYDWSLTAALKVDIIRAAQSALLATKHELVTMTAV